MFDNKHQGTQVAAEPTVEVLLCVLVRASGHVFTPPTEVPYLD